MATTTDALEKRLTLRAPPARVWRALSDAREFGTWFGCVLDGDLAAGATVRGKISSPGYDHLTIELAVEVVEPERLLAFRWHPYAIDPAIDYRDEPTTLVEIRLEPVAGGTLVTVRESGFDRIPAARRAKA